MCVKAPEKAPEYARLMTQLEIHETVKLNANPREKTVSIFDSLSSRAEEGQSGSQGNAKIISRQYLHYQGRGKGGLLIRSQANKTKMKQSTESNEGKATNTEWHILKLFLKSGIKYLTGQSKTCISISRPTLKFFRGEAKLYQ